MLWENIKITLSICQRTFYATALAVSFNLEIMRKLHAENPTGFIDLIYIDPPFNSKRDYNVLFEDIELKGTKAQKEAFADTWSNVSYIDTLNELQNLNKSLYEFLKTLDKIGISKSGISYLTTMAIRIHYMHKLLKETGSFFLHCDPTMSHYLKILLDIVFKEKNYRNEIIWERTKSLKTSQHKDKKFGVNTDIILFYTKSENYFFDSEAIKVPFSHSEIIERYPFIDEKGRYTLSPLFRSLSMGERPNLCYEYRGILPRSKAGWKVSKEKLEKIDEAGDLEISANGVPYRKFRPEYTKGRLLSNLWSDIEQTGGKERLGYPTQKPIALLKRILRATTKENDLIADFFCGCGTAIAAANELNRRWIGVDISHLAIKLIIDRLTKPYSKEKAREIKNKIIVDGLPKDIDSAKELATNTKGGRLHFQDWIIEVLLGGVSNEKKVADGGYDGYLTFRKTPKENGLILIEVKSGKVNVKNIREFIQVVKKEEADIGVFVCFEEYVTKPMQRAAKEEGYFENEYHTNRYDKIQIITVEDLLDGKEINLSDAIFEKNTFKKAEKKTVDDTHTQGNLFS